MDSHDNTCPVCHEMISVFGIGQCDHPICYKCSTRMRVLCEQMYCAICRTDLPEVLFIKKQTKFASIDRRGFISNRKHKIFFQNFDTEETYKRLTEYKCKICHDRPPERNFYGLKDHMRREHTLFCCDICLNHLKIFAFERKFYNRRDLAIHRRTGDEDDKSYKGHPLCKFCDERYMDNDELLRHLRKDHYFCHFCDEGSNEYYNDYEDLRQHFKALHYVCEMDQCIDSKFTNAFRSDIDLKAHIAKEHHQRFNKAQAKEARTLDINFQLAPRARGRARGVAGLTSEDYVDAAPHVQSQVFRGRGYRPYDNRRNDSGREERALIEKAREESLKEALKNTEKEMREIERKRREAAEVEERRMTEQEHQRKQNTLEMNFPALSGDPKVPSLVPPSLASAAKKASMENRSQPMAKRLTQPGRLHSHEYPSLSNSASGSNKKVIQSSGRDSPVQQRPVTTSAIITSNIQTVPQSVVDSMRKKDTVVQKSKPSVRSREGEDFPTLGSRQRAKQDNNVNLVSLGVWSGKSKKNERSFDNSASGKQQQNVPTTLASLGMDLYDNFTVLGKKGKVTAPSVSTKTVNSKPQGNVDNKPKSELSAKAPPKTRDKGLEEPPPASKGLENSQPKKPKKKQKKEKIEQASEIPDSAGSGKEGKSKKSKISVPPPKMFSEHSDRDSGIESSSGSVDSSTVLYKVEQSDKTESKQNEVPSTETSVASSSGVPTGSSLDCIAIGLLAKAFPEQTVPVLDDFPTLNSTPALAPPPPGFKTAAPPGFAKASNARPPPGFSSQESKNAPASVENFVFAKPANFSERNKALVQSVSDALDNDQDKFSEFKTFSGSYRQGTIDAANYYSNCAELLGQENFSKIAPELIALLPDIDKQQDLLSVHKDRLSSRTSVLKISGKSTRSPWSVSADFKSCPTCRQVLLVKDFDEHVKTHSLAEYPSLNGTGKQSRYLGQGSWIKAK